MELSGVGTRIFEMVEEKVQDKERCKMKKLNHS